MRNNTPVVEISTTLSRRLTPKKIFENQIFYMASYGRRREVAKKTRLSRINTNLGIDFRTEKPYLERITNYCCMKPKKPDSFQMFKRMTII